MRFINYFDSKVKDEFTTETKSINEESVKLVPRNNRTKKEDDASEIDEYEYEENEEKLCKITKLRVYMFSNLLTIVSIVEILLFVKV